MNLLYLVLGIGILSFIVILIIEYKKTGQSFRNIFKKIYSPNWLFASRMNSKKKFLSFSSLQQTILRYYRKDHTEGLRMYVRKVLVTKKLGKKNGEDQEIRSSIQQISIKEE